MLKYRFMRNILIGINTLSLHKLRSLLTVLGIVFGVGSVIAMISVGEGASREALEQIRRLGSTNILINSMKPIEEESLVNSRVHMSVYGLTYADNKRIKETMEAVADTVPAKIIRKSAYVNDRSMEVRLVGTTPEWFTFFDRKLLAGRIIGWRDVDQFAAVCVLTEHGARRLLSGGYSIGRAVRVGSEYFEVIGIVRSERNTGDLQSLDQESDIYIPLSTAKERFGDIIVRRTAGSREREMVELQQLLVQVNDIDQVEPTSSAIRTMLQRFHKYEDYRILIPLSLLRQAQATKRRFNIVLGSIAGISLLVGGIGIMNIMLASVFERTREIGIRRAIGAKRGQIISQFLIETMVLSVVGGILGIAVGIWLPFIITFFSGMPTVVPVYAVLISLGISVGVGLLFGMYPAVRAASLDPIVALRNE